MNTPRNKRARSNDTSDEPSDPNACLGVLNPSVFDLIGDGCQGLSTLITEFTELFDASPIHVALVLFTSVHAVTPRARIYFTLRESTGSHMAVFIVGDPGSGKSPMINK